MDKMDKKEENNEKSSEPKQVEDTPMKRIEDALVVCGFGKFNIKLLFTTFCAVTASMTTTTTSSYILPNAECDLKLTIMQKGMLNAVPFFGQIGAALFTGILIDAFGRKIFLVSGNLGTFICSILQGCSQTFWMLLLFKLIDGICLSLCWSATAVMLTELTPKTVRDRVNMFNGFSMSFSLIFMALIAWGFLTRTWSFIIVDGYFVLHSWNIYLLVNSLWSLIASISYYNLPESPKYLLLQGHEKKSLDVIRRIYCENTGKPPETFPVTTLKAEGSFIPPVETSLRKKLVSTLFDAKDLFKGQLVLRLMLFAFTTLVCLLTYTSLRLWFPQFSTIIENYQLKNGQADQFCVMVNDYTHNLGADGTRAGSNTALSVKNESVYEVCIPELSGAETYINAVIMGTSSLICIGISGCLVKYCGQKPLMFLVLLICAACSGGLYWTNSSIQIALMMSATCGLMQSGLVLQQNILIRVFPTSVRTLALSIILMVGRSGSLLGSLLFPILLNSGCMTPFLSLSCVCLLVATLVYFLPNPSKENKESGDK